MIENVLDDIRNRMNNAVIPSDVLFTIDDMNVIGDTYELGKFKFAETFPEDFEFSSNRIESFMKFELGDISNYRVLEFALLSNKILKSPVLKIFPWFEECYKNVL